MAKSRTEWFTTGHRTPNPVDNNFRTGFYLYELPRLRGLHLRSRTFTPGEEQFVASDTSFHSWSRRALTSADYRKNDIRGSLRFHSKLFSKLWNHVEPATADLVGFGSVHGCAPPRKVSSPGQGRSAGYTWFIHVLARLESCKAAEPRDSEHQPPASCLCEEKGPGDMLVESSRSPAMACSKPVLKLPVVSGNLGKFRKTTAACLEAFFHSLHEWISKRSCVNNRCSRNLDLAQN